MISRKLWIDPNFRSLPKNSQLMWFYLSSNTHVNSIGYYRLPKDYMVADLSWKLTDIEAALDDLINIDFIRYDEIKEVVLIITWFHTHPIKNFDHLKKGVSDLEELPKDSLVNDFKEACKVLKDQFQELLEKTLMSTSVSTQVEVKEEIKKEKEKEKERKRKKDSKARVIDLDVLTKKMP